MWGDRNAADTVLSLTRSALTVIAAGVPTLALIVAAAVIFWPTYGAAAAATGAVAGAAYLASVGVSVWMVFRHGRGVAPPRR